MTFLPLKTSLIALALFTAPALADTQSSTLTGAFIVAQADDGAEAGDVTTVIKKFLAVKRPVSQMADERLDQRLRRANKLLKTEGLSPDLQAGLEKVAQDVRAEIDRRKSSKDQAASGEQPAAPAADESAVEPQPEVQAQAQLQDAPAPLAAEVPADVQAFLQDSKPVTELSDKQLKERMRTALTLSKTKGLPKDTQTQLRQIGRAARAEILNRQQVSGSQPPADADEPSTQQPPAGQADQPQTTQLDGNTGNPEAEARAKSYLGDTAPADQMAVPGLRKRLQGMRELLAGNKLSQPTERALRQKLAADRDILRTRIESSKAVQKGKPESGQGAGTGTAADGGDADANNNVTKVTNEQTVKIVLADRRPPADLSDAELRRRIRILREAQRDNRHAEQDRVFWRDNVERDRAYLRIRLLDQRHQRQRDLNDGFKAGKINIQIGINFQPDRQPPPYVFAAEADEGELEEILAAPPRRKLERRYTLDEVESSPDLRDSVARIEIDTVHFGFGEGFLREEEIENLDGIAEIMEKILTAYPNEVFMIEGHTDAVGSDASNQELSRQRAAAVKQALVTFFVIPPENLKTVGFGERFLKIPTAEAEAENRRVSVARITALVGALED